MQVPFLQRNVVTPNYRPVLELIAQTMLPRAWPVIAIPPHSRGRLVLPRFFFGLQKQMEEYCILASGLTVQETEKSPLIRPSDVTFEQPLRSLTKPTEPKPGKSVTPSVITLPTKKPGAPDLSVCTPSENPRTEKQVSVKQASSEFKKISRFSTLPMPSTTRIPKPHTPSLVAPPSILLRRSLVPHSFLLVQW